MTPGITGEMGRQPMRVNFVSISTAWALAATLVFGLLGTARSQEDSLELDQMVVVGDRTTSRTAMESSVPVAVYSREDLLATGAAGNELGQALAILAPSFNFPRQSNSVTSDHIRAAQLRGMSPDQALVLINGKRRHPSAVVNDNTKIGRGTNAVDFNTIPLSAVKRVEILHDGASAQYGSDAIAGVINIVLDDRVTGGEVSVSYGGHHTTVEAIDRTLTDGQTATATANFGATLANTGFVRFGFELHSREPTNRAGFDNVPPGFIIPQAPANLALEGRRTHRVGDPDSEGVNLWFNSELPLPGFDFYASGTFSERETLGAAVFRYPIDDQNVPAVHPGGYLPQTTGDNRDLWLTAGALNDAGAWQIDTSLTYGRNEFDFGVENSLNPSLGPESPTTFHSGTFKLEQLNGNVDATRTVELDALQRSVRIATGLAYRHETFQSEPGDPASFTVGDFRFDPELAELVGRPAIGAQGAQGLSPADATEETRDVYGVYVEASSDLTNRLVVDLAARAEYYDDFGDTLTGKASAVYELKSSVRLRGSLSNSFRAPSVSQLGWARRTTTFGPDGDRVSARLVRPDSPIARALGAADLEEEQAINASLGLTASLGSAWNLTVDFYRIEVDDRITLSEGLEDDGTGATSLSELIQGLPGGEEVESVSYFTNAVDTRTRGAELTLEHHRMLGGGLLSLAAALSYAETQIRRIDAPPEALQQVNPNLRLVGVEEINTIEDASPDYKLVLNGTWRRGPWRLLGRVRHFGSAVRVFSFARQRFGAETAVDTELEYRFDNGLGLALGARNLFDNYPDLSNPANNFFGNFAYDILSPIGVNGRFIYARATLDLP